MTPTVNAPEERQTGRREIASLSGKSSLFNNHKFLRLWSLVFVFFLLLLYSIGLAPRDFADAGDFMNGLLGGADADQAPAEEMPITAPETEGVTPLGGDSRLLIPEIGVNAGIVLPESTDIDVLNAALTEGAVRYPSSAMPGKIGNVLVFGHSTGFKVVHNKNYAIFNRLSELKPGDIVRIQYNRREYWYKVATTEIKKAEEAIIRLDTDKKLLTLSTCNVFGAKEDRFVVEAEFVRSYPLRSSASAAGSSS